MKKNDVIRLEIIGMTAEGSGVGRYEGMAVFVPLTVIGDIADVHILKVKKNYAYGKLHTLIKPAEGRIEADCGSFKSCGGCVYRHISYETECKIKQNRVEDAVNRIGGINMPANPIIGAESTLRYRNKAQYPIAQNGAVGFYAVHSHRIIPCEDCLLQPIEFTAAAKAVGEWVKNNNISVYNEEQHNGLLRHLYLRRAWATAEIMAVLVINGNDIPAKSELIEVLSSALGEKLKSLQLNINKKDTNVILGEECRTIYGSEYITDILCGVKIRLSPLSFYQVNRNMAQKLYEKAAVYAKPAGRNILDLYCGAGTIGLSMAKEAKNIIGVEIVPQAVEDAKVNARENGIENARFICADACAAALQLKKEGISPDTVILDPPRKGCDEELLKTVANDFCPERIVYVSCDPATLARDIARLVPLGYALVEYTPVDLFPRTAHVESVALLVRTDSAI